jgi:drug/metabolite transporter (DMT)-like permease
VKLLNERLTPRAVGLALFTAVLWGGNSVAIKAALSGAPPISLAAARFLLGGLAILLWAILARIPLRLGRGERRGLALLLLLFISQIYLLNAGTQYTLASRSTVFISTYPFFTALFAHRFLPGDRLSRLKVAGMALSFLGVVLIFAESLAVGRLHYLPGDLMVLASGVLLGARQVYTKRLAQDIHPGRLLLWQAGLSIPIFVALSAAFESDHAYNLTFEVWGAVLYQGLVVAGFCFMVYTSLLKTYRASRLAVFGFITPVFGVFLSNALLGESISIGLVASVLLVGAGIAVVNHEA